MRRTAGTAGIEIRRARAEDWTEILRVLKTANFGVGGEEMREFPLACCFVAVVDGSIAGAAGYRILDSRHGKTTLLAVDPEHRGRGIGGLLQEARLAAMREAGVTTITTNTDDDTVMAWLERRYGFRKSGETVAKVHAFGRADKDRWTTMIWTFDS